MSNIFPNDTWENGLMDLGNGNDMFYIYFKARNPIKGNQTPLILWLTGGPGCSGLIALYMEHGPNLILRDGSFVYNPYSWNNNSDIIYVDSPIGTGFSRAANQSYVCHEENCVSRNLYIFLLKFYNKHPDINKRPFYIFGESYGGHYVPSISAYIIRANNSLINFKGYGVGNGLTDPFHQMGAYPKFLYENGNISFGQFISCQIFSVACVADLKIRPYNSTFWCGPYWGYLMQIGNIVNAYNIAINYTYDEQEEKVQKYLNQASVQHELGVDSRKWEPCNGSVGSNFGDDFYRSYKSDVEYALQQGYKVLIYAGDYDFICNWESNRNYLKFLNWKGEKEFNKQKLKPWMVGKEEAGLFESYENLMFIRIYKAGHMAPMDKPNELLYMLNNFVEAI